MSGRQQNDDNVGNDPNQDELTNNEIEELEELGIDPSNFENNDNDNDNNNDNEDLD